MKSLQRQLALPISLLLVLLQPMQLFATSLKTIRADWEYGGEATSFRLYQENALLCESFETGTNSMECDTYIGEQPISFTMTAMGPEGETPHSPPFTLVPPQLDPYGNAIPQPSFEVDTASGALPLQVLFDASGTTDSDGTIVDYEWDFGDGDMGSGMVASHTYYLPGTYTAILTATDNSGAAAAAEITISVTESSTQEPTADNDPPTAVLRSTSISPSIYQFNAYESQDADGLIVAYSWDFGDGSTASGSYVEHKFSAPGTYTVTLTVKDDMNATAQDQTVVTATVSASVGDAPTAVITTGLEQQLVTANWQYNDTSTVKAYRLYQNNSYLCQTTDSNAISLSCTSYIESGPMAFSLTAVDSNGAETVMSKKIAYAPSASSSILEGDAPYTLYFNGGASSDPDGSVVSYHWDFGDGDTENSTSATHTFSIGGIYTVTLSVTDNDGNRTTATTTVTVHGNTPPVALATSLTTNEDTAASGTLRATDTDNDTLIYTIAVNGSKGKASVTNSATGAFNYIPNKDAYGTDSFTFVAFDGEAYSNIATVNVTINAVNDPPVISGSAITTQEDTPATGTINASDIDTDSLTFAVVTNGSLGSALITNQQTGGFTYTPRANLNGSDSFTVSVNDGTTTKTATISVTINAVNDPPEAASDHAETLAGQTVGILALANDTDSDGDRLSILQIQAPAHGSAIAASATTIAYTPQATFSGEESFTYTVTDSKGGSDTGTITVTVRSTTSTTTTTTTSSTTQPTSDATLRATFQWEYNGAATDGFRIFMNNVKVCETSSATARSLTCDIPIVPGEMDFSIASVDASGAQSAPSALISFDANDILSHYKLVNVTWEHSSSSTLQGFHIYMNNKLVCQTDDPSARSLACYAPNSSTVAFTVTAIDGNNYESAQSNSLGY